MRAQADNFDRRRQAVAVAVEEDLVVSAENFDGDRFPIQIKDQGVIS